MFDYLDFNNKLWNFLSLNRFKLNDIFSGKDVEIFYDKKIYIHNGVPGTDIMDFIDLFYMQRDMYHSILKFFEDIKENNFISFSNLKEYNEIIGVNSYLFSYILPEIGFNEKKNMFIMPEYGELLKKFSQDILKRYNFVFPNLKIYEGKEVYLHIDGSGIINGVTFKGDMGYITNKTPYTSKVLPHNFNNIIEDIVLDKKIDVLVDSISDNSLNIFIGACASMYDFSNVNNKMSINSVEHSKINYIFKTDASYFSDLSIKDEESNVYVLNYLKTYKGWSEKISEIEDVIVNMSNDKFKRLVIDISNNISKSLSLKIKQIRAIKTVDLFEFLNIEIKAVKGNNFFNSKEVVCKINGFYETISLSENGRNSFVNKAELIEQVKGVKDIFEKLKTLSEKDILNMVFNKIKIESVKLPTLNNIVFDGVWKVGNKYAVVAKNKFYNLDELLNNGDYPVPKLSVLKGKEVKTLKTIISRVPDEMKEVYMSLLNVFFSNNKIIYLKADSDKSANKLVKYLTNASGFIKYVDQKQIYEIPKKLYNSNIVVASIVNSFDELYIDKNRESEFIGNKKEYGIEYDVRNTNSFLFICVDKDYGECYEDIDVNSDGLLDTIIRYVANSNKPNLKLRYVKEALDDY